MRAMALCICLLVALPVEGTPSADSPVRDALLGDALMHDRSSLPLLPPGSNFYDTSEFMLGSIAMVFILPESDGSIDPDLEDWTQAEQDTVTAEVLAGLDWWVARARWRDLTFHPVFLYSVPTGFEPISRSSYDEHLWVSDCLYSLGYAGFPYPLCIYEFANDVRDSLGTDWVVVAFIADSSDDADGLFANGVAAYSYLGGPNLIMSYKNGNAGIELMDWVTSHELAHSFYAWDEYHEMSPSCTSSIGYLDVENQNSVAPYGPGGCALDLNRCIMRLSAAPNNTPCYYTKGQIGWWDSDADSIPDILDTYPETVLFPYVPDPCSTLTPAYAGTGRVVPVPNLNFLGERNDITLEHISGVDYRVDGSAWVAALPVDGAWDEPEEDYFFTAGPLAPGPHIIETRAVQTCGNRDTTYAVDSLTVSELAGIEERRDFHSISLMTQPSPFAGRVKINYSVPGQPDEVILVSVFVYDIKGRKVRNLLERLQAPGSGQILWNGLASDGSALPSGVYFIRLVTEAGVAVRKVLLVR